MALDAGLYLIPSQLSDGPLDRVLPAYNIEVVGEISYFVVESLRSARRFLKKCNRDIDIDSLTFSELNEHSNLKDTAALEALLEPIGRGEAVVNKTSMNPEMTGFIAWCAWMFVHLIRLAGTHTNITVAIKWTWNLLSGTRLGRIITNIKL